MNIELFTDTGTSDTGINEDYVSADLLTGYMVVLDGASNLTKRNLTPCKSDSAWFSHKLGKNIEKTIGTTDESITDILYAAGKETADEFNSFAEKINRDDEPSAGLIVAKWQPDSCSEGNLEIATLGDCLGVVGFTDGATEIIYDEHLGKLDAKVINKMADLILRNGYSHKEAREAVAEDLMQNRLLRNRENGYSVADPSCLGYKKSLVRKYALDKVKFVFLCSDGCYSAVRMGLVKDYSELAQEIANGKGHEIMRRLRELENIDSQMHKFPRFKISDDATYGLVNFK